MYTLQSKLADYGLFLNTLKTKWGSSEHDFEEKPLDELKVRLLKKRQLRNDSGLEPEEIEEEIESVDLDAEELEYLKHLLDDPTVEERDVELAISLLGEDSDYVEDLIQTVFCQFPNLMRNLYLVFDELDEPEAYWALFDSKLKQDFIPEYEFFWMTKILVDYFKSSARRADMLIDIYKHPQVTATVKACILETPDLEFGFRELKLDVARNEESGMAKIAALSGLTRMESGARNHLYVNVGNTSPLFYLLTRILSKG